MLEYKGESWRATDARERGLLPVGEALRKIRKDYPELTETEAEHFVTVFEWHHQGDLFRKVDFVIIQKSALKKYKESSLSFPEWKALEETKLHEKYKKRADYIEAVMSGDIPPTAKYKVVPPDGHRNKCSFQKKPMDFWFWEGRKAFATTPSGVVYAYGGMTPRDFVLYDDERRREGNATAFTQGSSFETLPL